MTSDSLFVDFVADQMAGAGKITSRKMFGEYGVYCNGKIVALICRNRLYVKPTNGGRTYINEVVEKPPYDGAKPYFLIGDQLEDADWLAGLIRVSFEELPEPKKKKVTKKVTR